MSGSIVAGQFVVSPAWWRGGGEVRARAWCRAALPGLQAAELRVLCTTAVLRPLHLLADSLLYKNDHIIIEVFIVLFIYFITTFAKVLNAMGRDS